MYGGQTSFKLPVVSDEPALAVENLVMNLKRKRGWNRWRTGKARSVCNGGSLEFSYIWHCLINAHTFYALFYGHSAAELVISF
jgi:hypothetical protein